MAGGFSQLLPFGGSQGGQQTTSVVVQPAANQPIVVPATEEKKKRQRFLSRGSVSNIDDSGLNTDVQTLLGD